MWLSAPPFLTATDCENQKILNNSIEKFKPGNVDITKTRWTNGMQALITMD